MNKLDVFEYGILFILVSLLGIYAGILMHNYEVQKCSTILSESNQYYEAQANCYMPLQRPMYNLFWNGFAAMFIFYCAAVVVVLALHTIKIWWHYD